MANEVYVVIEGNNYVFEKTISGLFILTQLMTFQTFSFQDA